MGLVVQHKGHWEDGSKPPSCPCEGYACEQSVDIDLMIKKCSKSDCFSPMVQWSMGEHVQVAYTSLAAPLKTPGSNSKDIQRPFVQRPT